MQTEAKIYGIVTCYEGNYSRVIVQTVEINPVTGAFTVLVAHNIIYVGGSSFSDGITTFDQKNKRLYFSTNFDSDLVYGVDVTTHSILPSISINSDSVSLLEYDSYNNQLLIGGDYSYYNYSGVYTVPDDSSLPSNFLLNLTKSGTAKVYSSAVDHIGGIFHIAFYNATSKLNFIASFSLDNPVSVKILAFSCAALLPNFIFYDPTAKAIRGVGYLIDGSGYAYFEVIPGLGTCTARSVLTRGVVTAAAYDPTTSLLYLGYATALSQLLTYDISKSVLTAVNVSFVLSDVEVSFSL